MNILDENIPDDQRQILHAQRTRFHVIGRGIGRVGIKDEEIIPLLHNLGPATFLTLDLGFYRRDLCHPNYCLVCLDVHARNVAAFVRRFLRHPVSHTQMSRMGKVVRVTPTMLQVWEVHSEKRREFRWPPL